MPTHKLTPEIITAAIGGFVQQKLHIDVQIAALRPCFQAAAPSRARRRKLQKANGER